MSFLKMKKLLINVHYVEAVNLVFSTAFYHIAASLPLSISLISLATSSKCFSGYYVHCNVR